MKAPAIRRGERERQSVRTSDDRVGISRQLLDEFNHLGTLAG